MSRFTLNKVYYTGGEVLASSRRPTVSTPRVRCLENLSMSDSERWASYEESEKTLVSGKILSSQHDSNIGEASEQRFDARALRKRLMFGSIVGFATGATFATVDHFRKTSSGPSGLAGGTKALMRSAATSSGLFAGYARYQSIGRTLTMLY